ncbi:MAG TPA: carboxypeptidase regulatory-like domain-containing protein, partial [Kofleriaceae bacterium]|nr:carboxypeptidase regulatory-like domain-containing protein [Kofleriaceae bacterium]
MKRSRLVLAALAVLALVAWQTEAWRPGAGRTGERDPAPAPGGGNRTAELRSGALAGAPARSGWIPPARLDGAVTISGTVLDVGTLEGVGGVEVVFRSEAGEETTIAGADGRYRIDVPAGTYRAFVRDDTVLSVGPADHVRLPGLPTADAAGAPDEALMPLVVAAADLDGVDLTVRQGGLLRGQVVDLADRPVAGAVLRARSRWLRPTLGTDVAETASDGTFELRLPPGAYEVEVSHPRFAGLAGPPEERLLEVEAGEIQRARFTLAAGCVIA